MAVMAFTYGGTAIHVTHTDSMHPIWQPTHRFSRIGVPYGSGDRVQYGGRGDDTLDVACAVFNATEATADSDFSALMGMIGYQKRSIVDFFGQGWSNVRLEAITNIAKSIIGPDWVYTFRMTFTRRPDNG